MLHHEKQSKTPHQQRNEMGCEEKETEEMKTCLRWLMDWLMCLMEATRPDFADRALDDFEDRFNALKQNSPTKE